MAFPSTQPAILSFTPPPVCARFLRSSAKMRVLCGPVGSGKSVTSCWEILRRAAEQVPDSKGIRRTRFAIVRNTAGQLKDTTMKTFFDWFPEGSPAVGGFGHLAKTDKVFTMELALSDGTRIHSEIMFRALDDDADVRKLLSMELTGAWFNECREIAPTIVEACMNRVGRYPSKKDGGCTWAGVWGDTNPPVMDTWWYYQMEHISPDDHISTLNNGWEVFRQPSGRSPFAENLENLPEGYYDTTGHSDDYIRVYIDGEYGLSLGGLPVFPAFRADYHMAPHPLNPFVTSQSPLIVGVDLGLTPAAVCMQVDPRGRVLVYDEVCEFNMGIERFITERLRPLLVNRFGRMRILIVTDPAGRQRAQTDERSAIMVFKQHKFTVMPAYTNSISPRVDAVDRLLTRQVDTRAALLIDPRCARLKAALSGGYRWKLGQVGTIDKNEHSHVAEALQYGCLHITSQGGSVLGGGAPPHVQVAPATGWT